MDRTPCASLLVQTCFPIERCMTCEHACGHVHVTKEKPSHFCQLLYMILRAAACTPCSVPQGQIVMLASSNQALGTCAISRVSEQQHELFVSRTRLTCRSFAAMAAKPLTCVLIDRNRFDRLRFGTSASAVHVRMQRMRRSFAAWLRSRSHVH